MSTPHIAAERGEIAERVLMPGDPLRAKHIAETFLTDAKCYSSIRNVLGYTGFYKGQRISVQSTGMGIPSIAIYTKELITEYGAKTLIRVGSCGALREDLHLRDIVIAQGSSTDSSIIQNTFGAGLNFAPLADFDLLRKAYEKGTSLGRQLRVGNVMSNDRFYNDELDKTKLRDYGILAVEMESAGLYLLAAKYHVKALSIFTVGSSHVSGEQVTPEERQNSFNDMIKIALDTAIES